MLRYIENNQMIADTEAEKLYPDCKFLMINTVEENNVTYGRIVAVSDDMKTHGDLCRYKNSLQDTGLTYIGGSYNTKTLLNGTILFQRE